MRTLFSTIWAAGLISCGLGANEEKDAASQECKGCVPDASSGCEPCAVESGCDGSWYPLPAGYGPAPRSDASCTENAEMDTLRGFYRECEIDSNRLGPDECGLPAAGGVVCVAGLEGRARWSRTCHASRECPSGTACVFDGMQVETIPDTYIFSYGVCEELCSANSTGSVCSRCDMTCDAAQGICKPDRREHGASCRYDCDCEAPAVCVDSECRLDFDREQHQARCGNPQDPENCACGGGECVQGCCMLPSGLPASTQAPECTARPE